MRKWLISFLCLCLCLLPATPSFSVDDVPQKTEKQVIYDMPQTVKDGDNMTIKATVALEQKPIKLSLPQKGKAYFEFKQGTTTIKKEDKAIAKLKVTKDTITVSPLTEEAQRLTIPLQAKVINTTVEDQCLNVDAMTVTVKGDKALKKQDLWAQLTQKQLALEDHQFVLPLRLPKQGKAGERFIASLPKEWEAHPTKQTFTLQHQLWEWRVTQHEVELVAKEAWNTKKAPMLKAPLSLDKVSGHKWRLGDTIVTSVDKDKVEKQDTSHETTVTTVISNQSEKAQTTEVDTVSSSLNTEETTTTTETTTTETTATETTSEQPATKNKASRQVKSARRVMPRRNLNGSGIITSASISPSRVNDGDTVRFDAYFREVFNGQIRPYDTITFTFPKNSQGYVTPFSKRIAVYDDYGDNIGTLSVSGQQATLTFNETVSWRSNIAGHIYFDCEARNLTQSTSDNTLTFHTNYGISTLNQQTIEIHRQGMSQQPSQQPFYYKSGRMFTDDTDHVRWWLSGNLNQEWLGGDINIDDEIQDGQEMDWSTFNISFTGGAFDGRTMTLDEMEQEGVGTVIKYNDRHFRLFLNGNKLHGTSFVATYLTKITDDSRPSFKNNSKIWYRTYYGDQVGNGEVSNATVDNIHAGGDVQDKQIDLTIEKRDENQHHTVLMGAVFTLTSKRDGKVYKESTDGKGKILWKDIPYGNYTLEETKAPHGYQKLKTVYEVTIGKDGITTKNKDSAILSTTKDTITITNKKKQAAMKLPNTGGTGIGSWMMTGGVMVMDASVYLWMRRKEERE